MVPPPLLRRIRLALAALAVTLVALAWVVVRSRDAAPGQPAQPAHPERAVAFTDVAPFGANFFLEREPDAWDRESTVALAAQAGIRYAKQQFLWAYLEPERGRFEWDAYDEIVDLYRSHDIEVIARLDWPPGWVPKAEWVAEPFRERTNAPPADVDEYARFAAEVARHYRGRVRFYQIWNEPNLLSEWGFNPAHPVDPAEYAALLDAAGDAIREADPTAVILSAPLAINVETVDVGGNMSDLAYLRGLYAAGAEDSFDILSANAFGMDRPPDDPASPDVLNFRRAELLREIMVQAGDAAKPIWFAEYGWNAAPADAEEALWRRVPEQTQAAWTVDGVELAETSWPWAGVFNIWYFRQWGGLAPDRAVYYFRMVDVDWTPRRLYQAVQAAMQEREVAGPGYWAERSAPVRLPTDLAQRDLWSWTWADGATDRNALSSREPGATLTFRFRGRSVEGRFETGPQAGSVTAEVDGASDAPSSGAPVVSLTGPDRAWAWRELASDLPDGLHTLRLTVGAAGGTVTLDTFRVQDAAPGRRSLPLAPVGLGAVVLALVAAIVYDFRRASERIDT